MHEAEREALHEYVEKLETQKKKIQQELDDTKYLKGQELVKKIDELDTDIERIRNKITVRHRSDPQVVFELDSPLKHDLYLPIRFGTKLKKQGLHSKWAITILLLMFDVSVLFTALDGALFGVTQTYDSIFATAETVFLQIVLIGVHLFMLALVVKHRKNEKATKEEINETQYEE